LPEQPLDLETTGFVDLVTSVLFLDVLNSCTSALRSYRFSNKRTSYAAALCVVLGRWQSRNCATRKRIPGELSKGSCRGYTSAGVRWREVRAFGRWRFLGRALCRGAWRTVGNPDGL